MFCLMGLVTTIASAADTVRVGIVLPLTGDQANFGEIEKQSFDLAAEEINAAGGINGKKLELITDGQRSRQRSLFGDIILNYYSEIGNL